MKKIIILGSTGNLGTQTLDVLERHKDKFETIALTGYTREKLLAEQAVKFNVAKTYLQPNIDFSEADIVINLLSGIVGIEPTKTILKLGKTLLLANKEPLVAAGKEIMPLAKPGQIIPLDSEHNAIFEILKTHKAPIKRLIIPCSGGPFFGKTSAELAHLTAKDALAHPKWDMGAKISIESASLINKGLEIVEAYYLFNIPLEQIEARIHPQCLIHGIVEFTDGKIFAYKSKPDMREHIENALLHIDNEEKSHPAVVEISAEELEALPRPDHKTFPGIHLVLEALKQDRIKGFLEKEETIIANFLKGDTMFSELLKSLKNT